MIPFLKLLLIFIAAIVVTLGSHSISISQEVNPDTITLQGSVALEQNHYQQAIALFQQAEALYDKNNNQEGVTGTRINQAIALNQAGLKHRACRLLVNTLELSDLCDAYGIEDIAPIKSIEGKPAIIGLNVLANLLMEMGHLQEAEAVVGYLGERAPNLSSTILSEIIVQKANIKAIIARQRLLSRAISPRLLAQIQQYVSVSDRLLEQLIHQPNQQVLVLAIVNTIKTEALLKHAEIATQHTDKTQLYQRYLTPDHLHTLGNNRFKALANSAESLIQLEGDHQQISTLLEKGDEFVTTHKESAKLALIQGQFLDAQKATKQSIEPFYQRSAELATLSHEPIVAYTSYHRLAKLHNNQPEQAIALYKKAITQLEQAKSTLAITPNLLPKLEYDIQSIFHGYMTLLAKEGQPVGDLHTTMKQWQIDTYLRCSNYGQPEEQSLSHNNENIIHIIVLDDVIVTSLQQDDVEKRYLADKEHTLNTVQTLLHQLEPKHATQDMAQFKIAAQETYNLLLKQAIEENFSPGDVLHFDIDLALEELPIAVLFNGDRFIIEDYPITYTNGNGGLNDEKADLEKNSALIGSMSINNPNNSYSLRFPPLPEAELEARTIQQTLNETYLLHNEDFTIKNLKGVLDIDAPTIVHIATHGIFSANPRDTALVAWDRAMHPHTIGQLLRHRPLKLLVLSSCETAQGGRLGISGLALQSGAQHTIASLKEVDSQATYILMATFYQQLQQGNSIAQSIQNAQITLIHSSLFNHPAYWSPFILISQAQDTITNNELTP